MIISFNGHKIETKNVVMVLDIDHLTVTKRGQIMFSGRTNEKIVVTDEQELPLSAIVVNNSQNGKKEDNTIYLTPLSSQTVMKHLGAERDKESRDYNIWW